MGSLKDGMSGEERIDEGTLKPIFRGRGNRTMEREDRRSRNSIPRVLYQTPDRRCGDGFGGDMGSVVKYHSCVPVSMFPAGILWASVC